MRKIVGIFNEPHGNKLNKSKTNSMCDVFILLDEMKFC